MSANDLLRLADQARDEGRLVIAETSYRALFSDPSTAVRSEARFRLALMLRAIGRLAEAATLLRTILDEQPAAQRVRLELARLLDMMDDDAGARRLLREAQAGGLPPDVALLVDRYSAALRAQKPIGASIDIALAPDSNINRATRSDTLGTVIGNFEIDDDTKERSGVGFAVRGQGYARLPFGSRANLFGRLSGSADLYRDQAFNDVAVSATMGPELHIGADRLSLEAGRLWRWYGGKAYSRATILGLNLLHPLSRTTQLRGSITMAAVDHRLNRYQDGRTYAGALGVEWALSARAGVGLTLSLERQALRDSGYSSWSAQGTMLGYREVGPVTLVGTLAYGRLQADNRLPLFLKARSDHSLRTSLGATFRNFGVGIFAPVIRVTLERNRSSTEIYDYRRLRTELGISRAF